MAEKSDEFKEVKKLIASIQTKAADGQYIYRGTPEKHKWPNYKRLDKTDISSSIFRTYRENIKSDGSRGVGIKFNKDRLPVDFERDIINLARSHYPELTSNKEILTDIRHFGGLTTLIDFSHDLLVALFFACHEKPEEDGQLIAMSTLKTKYSNHSYFSDHSGKSDYLFKLAEKLQISDHSVENSELPKEIGLIEPAQTLASGARVIAQKSVFVHAPKGYINPRLCQFTNIKYTMKADILKYIMRFHHVKEATIYHDLHGFIAAQNHFAPALITFEQGNEYFVKEKYKEAIEKYTEAIKLKPDFAKAYTRRALATAMLGTKNV